MKTKKLSLGQWSLIHRDSLKSLWNAFKADTGSKMTFKAFCHFMYPQTIHF